MTQNALYSTGTSSEILFKSSGNNLKCSSELCTLPCCAWRNNCSSIRFVLLCSQNEVTLRNKAQLGHRLWLTVCCNIPGLQPTPSKRKGISRELFPARATASLPPSNFLKNCNSWCVDSTYRAKKEYTAGLELYLDAHKPETLTGHTRWRFQPFCLSFDITAYSHTKKLPVETHRLHWCFHTTGN